MNYWHREHIFRRKQLSQIPVDRGRAWPRLPGLCTPTWSTAHNQPNKYIEHHLIHHFPVWHFDSLTGACKIRRERLARRKRISIGGGYLIH